MASNLNISPIKMNYACDMFFSLHPQSVNERSGKKGCWGGTREIDKAVFKRFSHSRGEIVKAKKVKLNFLQCLGPKSSEPFAGINIIDSRIEYLFMFHKINFAKSSSGAACCSMLNVHNGRQCRVWGEWRITSCGNEGFWRTLSSESFSFTKP